MARGVYRRNNLMLYVVLLTHNNSSLFPLLRSRVQIFNILLLFLLFLLKLLDTVVHLFRVVHNAIQYKYSKMVHFTHSRNALGCQ